MAQVQIYDTTLRDGAQREGISFSVVDKMHIVQKLDELGVHYIEGGWPGSNPKDAEFFAQVGNLHLNNAQVALSASHGGPISRPKMMPTCKPWWNTGMKIATLVCKNSILQVTQVLRTTPEENLNMISDSIRFLHEKGMTVFYDAEHFFDGFKADKEYALECLKRRSNAGAGCLILCDTNGGALPEEIVRGSKGGLQVLESAVGDPCP